MAIRKGSILFDEIKSRGVEDILFISMDGFSGLEEGAKSIFKENYSMPKAKNEFYNSRKFEEIKRLMDIDRPFSEEIGQDEFLFGFMRTDTVFSTESEELSHLRSARAILGMRSWKYTGSSKRKGPLDAYKKISRQLISKSKRRPGFTDHQKTSKKLTHFT